MIGLTSEQKQRMEVRLTLVFFVSRTDLLVFEQILEVKLDVYNLAYIQHSVEMEVKSMQSESKKNDVKSSMKRWNIWRKATDSSHTGS